MGKVHIRPELESVMAGESFTLRSTKAWDSGVGCDVKFVYGDREINPFDSKWREPSRKMQHPHKGT